MKHGYLAVVLTFLGLYQKFSTLPAATARQRGVYSSGIALLLFLMATVAVLAQTSAGFNLEWHVMGSHGAESGSANYRVRGTIGQGIASQPTSDSARFRASSGYWFVDSGTTGTTIYLPTISRN